MMIRIPTNHPTTDDDIRCCCGRGTTGITTSTRRPCHTGRRGIAT